MSAIGIGLALLAVTLGGCEQAGNPSQETSQANTGNRVVAVSFPLQEFSQFLLGDQFTVECPAAASDNPRSWRPERAEIADMQRADWIVTQGTGASYAKWLVTVSLPDAKTIATATKGLSLRDFIAVEDVRIVHSHGPEGEHSHPTMVARTWLNPIVAKKQVKYLSERFQKAYPGKAEEIRQRQSELDEKFDALQSIVEEIRTAGSKEVISATFELKFLTKSLAWDDTHMNLEDAPSHEALETSLRETLEKLNAGSGFNTQRLLLIPQSMNSLATQMDPFLQQQNLRSVEIDFIDTVGDSYFQRMEANLQRIQKAIADLPR